MQRNLLILLSLLAVSGCIAQSRIQSKYIEAQDNCRSEAQARVPAAGTATGPTGTPDDPSIALARQFSECMNKAGWHVATPRPSNPLPSNGQTQASVLPSPQNLPATVAASRVTQQPATAAAGANANAMPVLGPGVTPNPAPATRSAPRPAAALQPLTTTPAEPPPATYQPGRPSDTDTDSSYGTGAGRQF